jgi:hypothetical protein
MSHSEVATGSAGDEASTARGLTRRRLLRRGAAVGAGVAAAGAVDAPPSHAQASAMGLAPTPVQTGAYTAAPGDFVPVDASAGSVTITLPNQPPDQSQVGVTVLAIAGPNIVRVACGASDVLSQAGGARALALSSVGQGVLLQYQASADIWHAIAQDVLRLHTGGSPSSAGLMIENYGNALQIAMQTDWAANTTGNTTYDSVDIFHKSAGDGVYVVHVGGVGQGHLLTGSVGANNGVTYVQNPGLLGADANAVTVSHVASGPSSQLSVSVSGSAVTVNLATDGSGSPASTAAQVIAAVNASSAIALLTAYPTAAASGTSDGSGIVGTLRQTNLAGGFTGSPPGANAALNPYVPFFLDDVGQGSGLVVGYRQGRKALNVTNSSAYDPGGVAINVSHAAGGPALNIHNQGPSVYGAPVVAGNGVAIDVSDYSSAASINIVRHAAPSESNPNGTFTWKPAVISVVSLPAAPFALLMSTRTADSQGVVVQNDGTAAFGINHRPNFGRLWVDLSNSGGAASNLVLSNPSASTNSGASLVFVAGGVEHVRFYSAYDTAARNGRLTVSMTAGGQTVHPLVMTPVSAVVTTQLQIANYPRGVGCAVTAPPGAAGFYPLQITGYDFGPQFTTSQDLGRTLTVKKQGTGPGTAFQLVNQGTGVTLDVQVGSPPASALQILANGQLKFAAGANEATGSGAAGLGSSCPAMTPGAPYTWEKVTTSDGSQGFIPVWK